MCSDQENVHNPCKVICSLEENSEPGNLSQTDRLQGKGVHEFLREVVASLFSLFSFWFFGVFFFVFRGERLCG